MSRATWTGLLVSLVLVSACSDQGELPPGSLVITQVPTSLALPIAATDAPSREYPPGSRVVLAMPPLAPERVEVLSAGLGAAGAAVVSPDRRRVAFMGRMAPDGPWQVYESVLPDGAPRRVTNLPGGAAYPAYLADGSILCTSPVPRAWSRADQEPAPALHAVDRETGTARRLTFGFRGIGDATVLRDGRILFTALQPACSESGEPRQALFVVQADGTGIGAYGANHEGPWGLRRPRETEDGRIVFVDSRAPDSTVDGRAGQLLAARPFRSRGPLEGAPPGACRSVEPLGGGAVLVAARTPEQGDNGGSFAIFRVGAGVADGVERHFDDPLRDDVEAVAVESAGRRRSHPSAISPGRDTGVLLCLDARGAVGGGSPVARPGRAVAVRVIGAGPGGESRLIGETALAGDGSFQVEVPADRALGFETLDARGHVLQRLSPSIWVRPGEIRSCTGCHAGHARAPANRRPLAVREGPVRLMGGPLHGLPLEAGQ